MISTYHKINTRRLISIDDLDESDIEVLYHTSIEFFEKLKNLNGIDQAPLQGMTVANMFFENSTRTRISFEVAEKKLGANIINFSPGNSSVKKGESLSDTVKNMVRMGADIIVVRDSQSGTALFINQKTGLPTINAGDGTNEHPTQALLDLFTIYKAGIKKEEMNILLSGDLLHSRVAGSAVKLWRKLGIRFQLESPNTATRFGSNKLNQKENNKPNILYSLRIQKERQLKELVPGFNEYFNFFGTKTQSNTECIVMHPGPINRNVELQSDLADSKQSLILEQVEMGVAVRMSVLYHLAQKKGV